LAGEISNGTPLTKPISMRPSEMTSSVEYSSATLIGSLRLPHRPTLVPKQAAVQPQPAGQE
jgi:hypothetical protein